MPVRRRRYSRLSKREGKRYIRQSAALTVLTILLLIALLFWGIPSLVKLAIFLSDLRTSTQPITGEDTVPPSPPVLQPVPEATSSAVIKLEGFAEEGSTIVVSINNVDSYETIVESDGEFLFDTVKLNSGLNRIVAVATDPSGNASKPSSTLSVTVDNEAPALVVDSPSDGQTFYGDRERTITVSGTTEPGSTVHVNGQFVILSQEGSFAHQLSLNEGENTIAVVAQDRAGNTAQEDRRVTFEP